MLITIRKTEADRGYEDDAVMVINSSYIQAIFQDEDDGGAQILLDGFESRICIDETFDEFLARLSSNNAPAVPLLTRKQEE